jgi:hypothetical protein
MKSYLERGRLLSKSRHIEGSGTALKQMGSGRKIGDPAEEGCTNQASSRFPYCTCPIRYGSFCFDSEKACMEVK